MEAEEVRKCQRCGETKLISAFNVRPRKNGAYTEKVCRACNNKSTYGYDTEDIVLTEREKVHPLRWNQIFGNLDKVKNFNK